MRTRLLNRAFALAAGVLLGTGASASLGAQEQTPGARYRVLVPALEAPSARQGEKLAAAIRQEIDAMDTHVSIAPREIREAFRKLAAKDEGTCLQYRQLMLHVNAQLVMCGRIDAAGRVSAQFVNPDGSSYDVDPFVYTSDAAAAEQIRQGFGTYVRLLRVLTFCDSYLRSSQWRDALANCNEAIALSPRDPHAQYGRGSALANLGQEREALAAFQQVLEVNPLHQDALLAAAIIAARLEETELKNRYLGEYFRLNPGNTSVRLNIATEMAQKGEPGAAVALLEEIEGADTADVTVRAYTGHFAMSAAARRTNAVPPRTAEAKAFFEKALHHYGYVVGVLGDTTPLLVVRNLMIAHGGLDQGAEALSWGARATSHPDADAQTWSAYADALRSAARSEDALAALDRVHQLDTSYAVQARRAFILTDLGRLNDAVAAIRAAAAAKELSAAQQDALAQKITKTGFDNFQRAKKFDQAFGYYDAARGVTATEDARSMIDFYHGFGLYEQARGIQEKGTVQTARTSLPLFQRAKAMLESAGRFTNGNASLAKTRTDALRAIGELIVIQEAIIKRG